jgi:hypothetical protein
MECLNVNFIDIGTVLLEFADYFLDGFGRRNSLETQIPQFK